jgi:hypothetical protein
MVLRPVEHQFSCKQMMAKGYALLFLKSKYPADFLLKSVSRLELSSLLVLKTLVH